MRYALLLAVALGVCTPAFPQHLGARIQWQPQMESDPRLAQPVEIEIIGRAAVPALEILSEKTGVSLSVAPEDLNTVGERKLTIISKGLTLKAIMAQLPEALQECHWDIDPSPEPPIYLLHRNAGADNTMKWLTERDAARQTEERRAQRVERMELAKRALAMSPEKLAELEKTDLLLARSVRDPHSRDLLEILLALPTEQADQFRDTGRLELDYAQAPERWQKAVERIADELVGRLPAWYAAHPEAEREPEEIVNWRDHLAHATISFEDWNIEHGFGVWLLLKMRTEQGGPFFRDVALMPHYPSLDEGESRFTRLLVATGTPDEDTAFQIAQQWDGKGFRADAAKREERHQREWIEPTDPDLLQTVTVGDQQFAEFANMQAFITAQTGIPVISDYFTFRHAPYISDENRKGLPLWRLLYILGEDEWRGDMYLWKKAGDCLVFHRADWAALAKAEIPESLILAYRKKLEDHGELTLDDLAEVAAILSARRLPANSFPEDLQRAGIRNASERNHWALLLYASLSPEQMEKLTSPEGLSFSDMNIAQRQQVIARAAEHPIPMRPDQIERATFHLVESTEDRHGRQFAAAKLGLRFPGAADEALVRFQLIQPAAQPEAKPAGSG